MKFLITSVTGRKGYKSFKNLNEYVDYMTKNGHLIKDLKEADVPYTEKPVKMVKATQSKGWEEVSDFGDVDKDPEKSASLIASTSSSVMKDEANMEFSKSSEKADKNEKGLGGESGDINMSDFKSFDYSEPELESSKNASKAQVEYKEVDTKETSETKSEPKKEEKEEEKKDSSKKYDKDIEECLKAAGVQLNEFFKFDAPEYDDSWEDPMRSLSDRKYIRADDRKFQEMCEKMGFDRFMKNCRRFFHQTGGSNTKENFLNLIGDNKNIGEIIRIVKDNSDKYGYKIFVDFMRKQNGLPPLDSYDHKDGSELQEGIKDYLPRAGFIRDDDEDKNSSKMGVWGGQGTDEQLRKAKIIAKVKFANGDRFGRVTKADLDNFDEYKAQYDEIYGSDELDEGWKDKLKKGAAAIGVAGALAGNAMANDTSRYDYDFDPNHYEQVELDANDCRNPNCSFGDEDAQTKSDIEKPQIKKITKNGMIIDQFGNEWTRADFDKLLAGKDPFYDGARNPNIEESEEMIEEDDDSLNVEIAECLRAAGC